MVCIYYHLVKSNLPYKPKNSVCHPFHPLIKKDKMVSKIEKQNLSLCYLEWFIPIWTLKVNMKREQKKK